MKNLIERIENLCEANFEKDSAIRAKARSLFDGLFSHLSSQKKPISFKKELRIDTRGFWKEDDIELEVIFLEFSLRGNVAALGSDNSNRNKKTLYLHLLGPAEIKKGKVVGSELADRLEIGPIVHEIAHAFDPGAKFLRYGKDQNAKGFKQKYYNDPTEWNSFWQEGAARFEDAISSDKAPRYRTVSDLIKDAKKYWSSAFLDHMDSVTERKFNKRMYDLWFETSNSIG